MADSAVDLAGLTENQQLALQQFTSVTDQELSAAIPLLRQCQWNAQIAITRFFDGDADTVDPVAEAARVPPPQTTRQAATLMNDFSSRPHPHTRRAAAGLEPAPRVVPTPENQLTRQMPFPVSILLLPVNISYAIFARVFGAVGYCFPFLPRLLARFWSGRASQPSRDQRRRPLGPRDTAERFIREFEEEHGVTHGTLPFHEGGYAQAFDVAKRDLKYLLVVLLSPEHDDNSSFVKDTLLAPEVIAFVSNPSNNVIFWAGTVQDAEAYQVSAALNVTRFPFVCLIVHTPEVSSTAMSKVATSSGPVSAQDLVTKLQAGISSQSQGLERVRRQRREQEATRNLRQEQESAYERSLAQDREKARRRKEEEAAQEMADREERDRAERKANEARNLAQWRRWRAQSIHPEPDADVKDVVRISIRLASGERVVRRFRPEDDLEELYALVECHDQIDQISEKFTTAPANYEHVYRFQLVSPMPREVYDLEKEGSLRGRIGRSGNLIVEKIATEDDDEEADDDDDE